MSSASGKGGSSIDLGHNLGELLGDRLSAHILASQGAHFFKRCGTG